MKPKFQDALLLRLGQGIRSRNLCCPRLTMPANTCILGNKSFRRNLPCQPSECDAQLASQLNVQIPSALFKWPDVNIYYRISVSISKKVGNQRYQRSHCLHVYPRFRIQLGFAKMAFHSQRGVPNACDEQKVLQIAWPGRNSPKLTP